MKVICDGAICGGVKRTEFTHKSNVTKQIPWDTSLDGRIWDFERNLFTQDSLSVETEENILTKNQLFISRIRA